nr:hypothetical protein [Tanacetum cinerariifolium]
MQPSKSKKRAEWWWFLVGCRGGMAVGMWKQRGDGDGVETMRVAEMMACEVGDDVDVVVVMMKSVGEGSWWCGDDGCTDVGVVVSKVGDGVEARGGIGGGHRKYSSEKFSRGGWSEFGAGFLREKGM